MASSFEKSVKGATKIKVRHRLPAHHHDAMRCDAPPIWGEGALAVDGIIANTLSHSRPRRRRRNTSSTS